MPFNAETKNIYAKPDELIHFENWISRTVPSRFVLLESGVQMLPDYYQEQHQWLVKLRDWALHFNFIASVAEFFPSASIFLFPLLFILSMPFFRTYYGYRPLLIFSAGLVYLSLFSVLLNKYIPIPPPFFVDHSFIPTNTFLFSFPSNEVTFITFIFGYLTIQWPGKRYMKERIMFAFLGLFLVIACIIKNSLYGESYPSTILLSIVVSLAYCLVFRYVRDIRFSDRKRAFITLRFWILTTIITGTVANLSDSVRDDFIAIFTLSISIAILLLKIFPSFTMSIRREIPIEIYHHKYTRFIAGFLSHGRLHAKRL